MRSQYVVETLCEGGSGSEASIIIQRRTCFPGMGGTVVTEQTVVTALRVPWSVTPDHGIRSFLRHALIKKLDDYFLLRGIYLSQHVTRPLGSFSADDKETGYLYEWVMGMEGFPWEYYQNDGSKSPVSLKEWGEFIGAFYSAGIDMQMDIADPDNGMISKNIIHKLFKYNETDLNPLWVRIDFGSSSINIDPDKLKGFLDKKQVSLTKILGQNRFDLMILAWKFLYNKPQMTERDLGRLDILARDYRTSSLRHKMRSANI
ncbi:MAG: hypothetical protein HZC14_03580 [Candidatus Niyogibacteria bacterium]|nr:hypothetical protein [Candidatus Niyogibacteria bacterium]